MEVLKLDRWLCRVQNTQDFSTPSVQLFDLTIHPVNGGFLLILLPSMITMLVLLIALLLLLSCTIGLAYTIYNLYFHPYAKYPGPFLARISPFYSLWHAYAGDLHIDVLQCHEKYGKYIV